MFTGGLRGGRSCGQLRAFAFVSHFFRHCSLESPRQPSHLRPFAVYAVPLQVFLRCSVHAGAGVGGGATATGAGAAAAGVSPATSRPGGSRRGLTLQDS